VIHCDVLCGSVSVRRPDWMMRRRDKRAGAESGPAAINPAD
jgi:hypothetical protein